MEYALRLPVTGNLDRLEHNYRKQKYTWDCADLNGDIPRCWDGALKYGNVEYVTKILATKSLDESEKLRSFRIAVENNQTELISLFQPLISNFDFRIIIEKSFLYAARFAYADTVMKLLPFVDDRSIIEVLRQSNAGGILKLQAGDIVALILEYIQRPEYIQTYPGRTREIISRSILNAGTWTGYPKILDRILAGIDSNSYRPQIIAVVKHILLHHREVSNPYSVGRLHQYLDPEMGGESENRGN